MNKKHRIADNIPLILLLLMAIPLFFINIRNNHDWGGDFAMYLAQAQNIASGQPSHQSLYIFNESAPVYGPPSYPPGFPLLLSPVVGVFGLNFEMLMRFQSFWLALLGFLSFLFFRRHSSQWPALLLSLIIMYHPWSLNFKSEIMSDIPFAVMMLASIMLIQQKKRSSFSMIAAGFLMGFAMITRSIGFVLPLALAGAVLIDIKNTRIKNLKIKKYRPEIQAFAACMLTFTLFNFIIFPAPSSSSSSYLLFSGETFTFKGIMTGLSHYSYTLHRHFWLLPGDEALTLNVILSSLFILALILGIILKIKKKTEFSDIVFLLYLGVIIFYPYRHGGFRFLLPLFPFLMAYFFYGLTAINGLISLKKHIINVIILLVFLISCKPGISKIIERQDKIFEGPQKDSAKEAFAYIRNNTKENEPISFIRPRVLALFTNRTAMGTKYQDSEKELLEQYKKHQIKYILINKKMFDQNVRHVIDSGKARQQLIFQNDDFEFYKIFNEQ